MQYQRPYNIFVSWSLEPSKSIALVIKRWLKSVIQNSNPFMSEEDIESGAIGFSVIAEQLESIRVGVFCVTSENQYRTWLNYEAGAISKGQKDNRVIPLLFDLTTNDFKPPLGQYQARSLFEYGDMLKFTKDVALQLDAPLNSEEVKESFDRLWPELLAELTAIKDRTPETAVAKRTDGDKIDELLTLTRSLFDQVSGIRQSQSFRPQHAAVSVGVAIRRNALEGKLLEYAAKPIADLTAPESLALHLLSTVGKSEWSPELMNTIESIIGPSLVSWRVTGHPVVAEVIENQTSEET